MTMKTTNYIKHSRQSAILVFGALLCLIGFGCKKFVQIPPPQTQLVTTNVFSNNATATSALTNIYTLMWTNAESYFASQCIGIYADELNSSSISTAQVQLYTNSLLATTTANNYGPWTNAYKYIYDANAVIENLQKVSGCSPAVKQQLSGEAYFIRAFWHFYLTNIYGDVPLALSTSYTINNSISRTARVQVLQQVVKDLQIAQGLLNPNYVDASDTISTTARVRPNQASATALLARAYLYLGDYSGQNMGDYAKADSAATAIIGNSVYGLTTLGNVFSPTSKEAIWQIQTPSPTSSTYAVTDGQFLILTGAPGTNVNNTVTISPQLMGAFESGDQRQSAWIGAITVNKTTYYFPYKYKVNSLNYSSSNITEYDTPLRLGEIYLIRAEARAHEGNITGAQSDLNAIRTRAGLGNTTASTQASLLTAILHERQVELFTEWGHRWFDLCRTGNAPSVMGPPGNVCQAKGGIWFSNNYQLLFPIPQADRNIDFNLSQNPGY